MKHNLFTFALVLVIATNAMAAEKWVTSDRLNRRTCADTSCGVVGKLFFRENVKIYETKNGWARISNYYYASCRNGVSEYVQEGNSSCTEGNGIVGGRLAEWAYMKHLGEKRPPDPSAGAKGDYALISGSDDYQIYKDIFAQKASDLVLSGRCTENDFKNIGGWRKSSNRKGPIYFTYCGGFHVSKRLYLNASTGEVFK